MAVRVAWNNESEEQWGQPLSTSWWTTDDVQIGDRVWSHPGDQFVYLDSTSRGSVSASSSSSGLPNPQPPTPNSQKNGQRTLHSAGSFVRTGPRLSRATDPYAIDVAGPVGTRKRLLFDLFDRPSPELAIERVEAIDWRAPRLGLGVMPLTRHAISDAIAGARRHLDQSQGNRDFGFGYAYEGMSELTVFGPDDRAEIAVAIALKTIDPPSRTLVLRGVMWGKVPSHSSMRDRWLAVGIPVSGNLRYGSPGDDLSDRDRDLVLDTVKAMWGLFPTLHGPSRGSAGSAVRVGRRLARSAREQQQEYDESGEGLVARRIAIAHRLMRSVRHRVDTVGHSERWGPHGYGTNLWRALITIWVEDVSMPAVAKTLWARRISEIGTPTRRPSTLTLDKLAARYRGQGTLEQFEVWSIPAKVQFRAKLAEETGPSDLVAFEKNAHAVVSFLDSIGLRPVEGWVRGVEEADRAEGLAVP